MNVFNEKQKCHDTAALASHRLDHLNICTKICTTRVIIWHISMLSLENRNLFLNFKTLLKWHIVSTTFSVKGLPYHPQKGLHCRYFYVTFAK